MHQKTIDLPPLDLRAAVGEIDPDARTVALTFSTGADVVRYDWMTGKRYVERLSMDPAHIRLGRLNSGAPLLDSHSAYSIAHQMGVIEDGSAAVKGKKGTAVARFSRRADVEPYYQDVLDRIIRNVSVGYRVHRFEETQGKNQELPVRLATDWEPYEVSLTPMGADAGAQMRRGAKEVPTNTCVLVTRRVDPSAVMATIEDADRARRLRFARAVAR
jgi:hypothetical protein